MPAAPLPDPAAAAQAGDPAAPAQPDDPASPNGVSGKRRTLPTPRIPALRRTAGRRAAQTRVAATPPVAPRPALEVARRRRAPGAEPPPPPQPTPEVPAASGDASIVLAPADPVAGLGGVPGVDPGSMIAFRATLRNESQIVDNYDLAVLGLPEGWTTVAPAAAFLVPLGSGRGDSEQELRIDISPPRDYRSTAGIWTFELIALSRTHATVAARAIAQFEVRPFQAWSVEVIPTVNSGRFKARYRAAVRNDGNAEQDLWPVAIEDSGKLRMAFTRGRLTLEAGEVGADTLTLKPRLPKPVGRAIEHRVGVDVVAIEPEVEETQSAKAKLAAKAKEKGKETAKGVKVSAKGIALPRPRIPRPQDLLRKFKPDPNMLSRLRGGPADANAPLTARQIVFRQKPVIPFWLIALIVLIAIAGVAIYLLLPRKTTVPNLVGVSTSFEAEKRLRANDLVLTQPPEPRVKADAKPGSVIGQSPAPGAKVDKDASVSIVVAVGDQDGRGSAPGRPDARQGRRAAAPRRPRARRHAALRRPRQLCREEPDPGRGAVRVQGHVGAGVPEEAPADDQAEEGRGHEEEGGREEGGGRQEGGREQDHRAEVRRQAARRVHRRAREARPEGDGDDDHRQDGRGDGPVDHPEAGGDGQEGRRGEGSGVERAGGAGRADAIAHRRLRPGRAASSSSACRAGRRSRRTSPTDRRSSSARFEDPARGLGRGREADARCTPAPTSCAGRRSRRTTRRSR